MGILPTARLRIGASLRRRSNNPVGLSPSLFRLGLLYSYILLPVIPPAILVFGYAWGYDHHSYGLFVLTYFPESWMTSRLKQIPCELAWVVRVESDKEWYLDSERIAPAELPARLRERMGERKGCMLVFDANPDIPFAEAVKAIEVIQQAGGRVVLLTPQTKKAPIPSAPSPFNSVQHTVARFANSR